MAQCSHVHGGRRDCADEVVAQINGSDVLHDTDVNRERLKVFLL